MSDLAAPVERTTRGIRSALFDELDAIRSGKSAPGRASSVAKIAGQIVEMMRAEIEVHRYLKDMDPEERRELTTIKDTISLAALPRSVEQPTTPVLVPAKAVLPPSSIAAPSKAQLMGRR